MTHAALIVAWWFLATRNPTTSIGMMTNDQVTAERLANASIKPEAFGPYPTEAMCRAAERLAMPSNPAFWIDEDRQNEAKRKAWMEAAEKYQARLAQLVKQNPKKGIYKLPDGTIFGVCGENGYDCPNKAEPETQLDPESPSYVINQPPTLGLWIKNPGKTIPPSPRYSDYPHIPSDSYTVNEQCEPVKAWYAATK